MNRKHSILPFAMTFAISSARLAQATPPWSNGANDPAADRGYVFHVADVDSVPGIHGNPCGATSMIGASEFAVPLLGSTAICAEIGKQLVDRVSASQTHYPLAQVGKSLPRRDILKRPARAWPHLTYQQVHIA